MSFIKATRTGKRQQKKQILFPAWFRREDRLNLSNRYFGESCWTGLCEKNQRTASFFASSSSSSGDLNESDQLYGCLLLFLTALIGRMVIFSRKAQSIVLNCSWQLKINGMMISSWRELTIVWHECLRIMYTQY